MSPSRRRATARCAAWHRAPRWGGGVTGRRALRGPGAPAGGRGRTETLPSKTLSVCYRHYTRALLVRRDDRPPGLPARALPPLSPQNSHGHYTRVVHTRALPVAACHPVRRDGRLSGLPARAAVPLPVAVRHRGARLGIVRTSRAPWCGPVAVGRDVPIAPPRHRRGARLGIARNSRVVLRARITHATLARARWACAPPVRRGAV